MKIQTNCLKEKEIVRDIVIFSFDEDVYKQMEFCEVPIGTYCYKKIDNVGYLCKKITNSLVSYPISDTKIILSPDLLVYVDKQELEE